eukprot:s2869_g5.t1
MVQHGSTLLNGFDIVEVVRTLRLGCLLALAVWRRVLRNVTTAFIASDFLTGVWFQLPSLVLSSGGRCMDQDEQQDVIPEIQPLPSGG